MPDAKERLTKLLDEFPVQMEWHDTGELAEYLLSHGVVFVDNMIALAKDTVFGMWIPVTQALPHFFPERRRKVFVTLEDRDGKRFTSVAKYNEEYKQWEEFTDYRFSDSRYFKVVAWMVKPAPWKEDKHGAV